jgi:hypothetical protein
MRRVPCSLGTPRSALIWRCVGGSVMRNSTSATLERSRSGTNPIFHRPPRPSRYQNVQHISRLLPFRNPPLLASVIPAASYKSPSPSSRPFTNNLPLSALIRRSIPVSLAPHRRRYRASLSPFSSMRPGQIVEYLADPSPGKSSEPVIGVLVEKLTVTEREMWEWDEDARAAEERYAGEEEEMVAAGEISEAEVATIASRGEENGESGDGEAVSQRSEWAEENEDRPPLHRTRGRRKRSDKVRWSLISQDAMMVELSETRLSYLFPHNIKLTDVARVSGEPFQGTSPLVSNAETAEESVEAEDEASDQVSRTLEGLEDLSKKVARMVEQVEGQEENEHKIATVWSLAVGRKEVADEILVKKAPKRLRKRDRKRLLQGEMPEVLKNALDSPKVYRRFVSAEEAAKIFFGSTGPVEVRDSSFTQYFLLILCQHKILIAIFRRTRHFGY